jgi:SpoVK/Ycf46/Vps4 family AAA+-type ATPase
MKTNGSNSSVPASPPMYITETTIKREVFVEQVNNSYKNVKTLYLCDQDKKKLFSSLDVFKYKRDLLESLGLPYKLGVLLYGEPGCGKSSAILAIASFLQKDIFYIDLNTVKTNRELKMIFDHVYTLNANGGIIAMEDIDCASNIVLQRKEMITGEGSGKNNNEEDILTLDFLLNLLQGTLTKEGTVFIATTNYIQKLDTALVRDGRFDVKIELKKCNREQLSQMFYIFFGIKLSESLLHRFREFQFIPATILSRMSEYLTSGNVIIPEEVLYPFLNID